MGFDLRLRRDAFVNVSTELETEVIVRRMVEDAHLLLNGDLPEEPGMFDVFRMIKQRESIHAISNSFRRDHTNAPVDDVPLSGR